MMTDVTLLNVVFEVVGGDGKVIGGSVEQSREGMKTSLTREVMRLVFPVPSSPQTQIRTGS